MKFEEYCTLLSNLKGTPMPTPQVMHNLAIEYSSLEDKDVRALFGILKKLKTFNKFPPSELFEEAKKKVMHNKKKYLSFPPVHKDDKIESKDWVELRKMCPWIKERNKC